MPFGMSDTDDEIVRLLRQIQANTSSSTEPDVTKEVNLNGTTADERVGLIPARSYITVESDNLDHATDAGTVVLEPGDSVPIVEYRDTAAAVYAVGATDKQDVEYTLEVDNATVGGRTNSPLGLLNEPFSFVNTLGGAVPVESSIEYVAHYDENADGTIEIVGRLHLEVM